MPSGNAPIPTRQETEQQLQRMLSSKVFAARPRQAEVFRFLVNSTLEGTGVSEKDLRTAFFPTPPYDPESTIARTTVDLVRRLISDYYSVQGEDDLVLIDLPRPAKQGGAMPRRIKQPPGKAYMPTISYNPRSGMHKEYLLGMHLLGEGSSTGHFYAADHFAGVIKENPSHIAAHLGLATIYLREALCRGKHGPARKKVLQKAESEARAALRLDHDSWNANALIGAIHCCRSQWEEAGHAFASALNADRAKTCHESWYYPAYLLAIGRSQEGLAMVAARAAGSPGDPMAVTAHGIFLYATRDYAGAFSKLNDAQMASPNNWLAELFLVLLHLEERSPIEYLDAHLTKNFSKALEWVNRARLHMGSYRFPGVTVLTAARDGKKAIARKLTAQFHDLAAKEYISAFDWALFFIATGDPASAVKSLNEARADEDPLLAWLRLWPFLDPLRTRPAFRSLVKRMRFPDSV